jgi:hypothetical protein
MVAVGAQTGDGCAFRADIHAEISTSVPICADAGV